MIVGLSILLWAAALACLLRWMRTAAWRDEPFAIPRPNNAPPLSSEGLTTLDDTAELPEVQRTRPDSGVRAPSPGLVPASALGSEWIDDILTRMQQRESEPDPRDPLRRGPAGDGSLHRDVLLVVTRRRS